jgi:hypothetical protein
LIDDKRERLAAEREIARRQGAAKRKKPPRRR